MSDNADSRIVNKLRNALEFAKFASPEIRDAVSNCIKELAKDMQYVEFEPDINTIAVFKDLDAVLNDYENQPAIAAQPTEESESDHEVDRESPDVFIVEDEVEHILTRGKVVEDDDDDVD